MWVLLAGLAARFLTATVLRWLAWKAVMFTIFTVILPIVLSNVMHKLLQTSMTLAGEQAAVFGMATPMVASFGGMLGFFLVNLRIPEVVAIMMGALGFRAAMSFVPGRR